MEAGNANKENLKLSGDVFRLSEIPIDDLLNKFDSRESGLTLEKAGTKLLAFGANEVSAKKEKIIILEFLSKFTNPLVLTLLIISAVSFSLGEKINSIIVIMMAFLSAIFSFVQEFRATRNAEKLAEMIKVTANVRRDGKIISFPIKNIVPGDIVILSAGNMIPADVRIISTNNLYINQSALNGESFPVPKTPESSKSPERIFDLENIAFMGSSVMSGNGEAVVIKTGKDTQFGQLSADLAKINVETAFDKGIKSYTWLMLRLILILGVFIFFSNSLIKGNVMEALLFALAVAVGLAPEMLPMIVTVNLSKGAMVMAKKKVIIKRLDSIQNFGAMDVLCTDKTGTLTLDSIALVKHCDIDGNEDESVLKMAYLNSYYQAGMKNVLDQAVLKYQHLLERGVKKIDEIPFDFERRIVSVITESGDKRQLIAKGAPEEIIKRISFFEKNGKRHSIEAEDRKKFRKLYDELSAEGFRVLAVAYKNVSQNTFTKNDEKELVFKGFTAFLDPPKPTVAQTLLKLEQNAIKLKILSGDNELVTRKICSEINLKIDKLLHGDEIDEMNDAELAVASEDVNVFVRLTPLQKERVIQAIQAKKHIVGYLGDGINDAPALKRADVGISVNNATDIAKETAAMILLEKNLDVLCDGVIEGRKVFANVIKYIKMGASSNLGNMISMAAASIFLPFLPMLPSQVLLNNFLYDISQTAIPVDAVDDDYLKTPRPWNIKFIQKFMLVIGPVSSIFDFLTFGVMWYIFHASPDLFRTGWFVESLATQTLVVFIIRTRKIPFIESAPSKLLLFTTTAIVGIGIALPYTIIGKWFSFQPLPAFFFLILFAIVVVYLLLVQLVKVLFTKKYGYE